jgi:hypothetical protein
MAMKHSGNQVRLGDKMYFFQSPKEGDVADCLLLGHGAYYSGEGMCAIGSGYSVTYYCKHTEDQVKFNQGLLIMGPKGGGYSATETQVGACETYNYYLGKSQGKHSNAQEEYRMNYEKIAEIQAKRATDAYCPHVVTISNHNMRKGRVLTLREVIEEVCRHDRNIRNIHYGGCRKVIDHKFPQD